MNVTYPGAGNDRSWVANRVVPGSNEEISLVQNPNGGPGSNLSYPTGPPSWSLNLAGLVYGGWIQNPNGGATYTQGHPCLCGEPPTAPATVTPEASYIPHPSPESNIFPESHKRDENLVYLNLRTGKAFKFSNRYPQGIETVWTEKDKKLLQKGFRKNFKRKK